MPIFLMPSLKKMASIKHKQIIKTYNKPFMKKIIYAALCVATLFATSCKKEVLEQGQKELVVSGVVDTLKGNITVNTTVTKTTYLKGLVYIKPGVTLKVNPGVTIKGSNGGATFNLTNLENNKGTLIVEKGAKLIANGTASSPIVWTSEKVAGQRDFGDWGGIVILGNAPIISSTGATNNIFEALTDIPNTGGRNNYGGTSTTDNSGSITYNRIDFAGGVISAANREVNGLTLCGVGSGTTLKYIEVSNSGDDAFEFFGGTVNASYLVSFGNKDDDYDFDEAYTGRLQFIIAYRNSLADISGSSMIELDNNASANVFGTKTLPFIANVTLIGPASAVVRTTNLSGNPIEGSHFDAGIYVRRSGLIRLANSLIIAQAMGSAFACTPTTYDNLFLSPTALGASAVVCNLLESSVGNINNGLIQSSYGSVAALYSNESNPILLPETLYNNGDLLRKFENNSNAFLRNYASFKLGAALNPLNFSPALNGGINLAAYGFVGTTQRGAVRSTDIWTAGSWISTDIH